MTSTVPALAHIATQASFNGVLATVAALGSAAWLVDGAQGHVLAANVEGSATCPPDA